MASFARANMDFQEEYLRNPGMTFLLLFFVRIKGHLSNQLCELTRSYFDLLNIMPNKLSRPPSMFLYLTRFINLSPSNSTPREIQLFSLQGYPPHESGVSHLRRLRRRNSGSDMSVLWRRSRQVWLCILSRKGRESPLGEVRDMWWERRLSGAV